MKLTKKGSRNMIKALLESLKTGNFEWEEDHLGNPILIIFNPKDEEERIAKIIPLI